MGCDIYLKSGRVISIKEPFSEIVSIIENKLVGSSSRGYFYVTKIEAIFDCNQNKHIEVEKEILLFINDNIETIEEDY